MWVPAEQGECSGGLPRGPLSWHRRGSAVYSWLGTLTAVFGRVSFSEA